MSLSGYKNSRWSVVFCLGLMVSVRMYHRCTDDYWIRRLMSHLLCLHTLNSEVRWIAYKFFTLLFMQMARLPSYLTLTTSLLDLTTCIMRCFSLDNLSTSDVSVTAVKARTNWHILFWDGQLWFCKFPSSEWTEIFNPRSTPPPFFS